MKLLDPTSELQATTRENAPRLARLDGVRVGLLDISKARGNVFLDRLEELLGARGVQVDRFRKPTFTKPAPDTLVSRTPPRSRVLQIAARPTLSSRIETATAASAKPTTAPSAARWIPGTAASASPSFRARR